MSKMSQNGTSVAILKGGIAHCGGVEKQTLRLAEAFTERGCRVTIVTSGDIPSSLQHNTVSVCSRHRLSLQHLLTFDYRCQKWLNNNPHDIVFGMDRNSQQSHYRAGNGVHRAYLNRRCLIEGKLKCASFSINPFHRAVLAKERHCFESPDLKTLFVNSQMVADEALTHYNIDPNKITIVHNGVEWQQLENSFSKWEAEKPTFCEEHTLDPEVHQFLFVGQGYRRKGLSFLLRGLINLRQLPWQLSVIGKDREEGAFSALANKLGIGDKVFFHGHQDDISPFYQIADTLCIPSSYDPFANVTVEALAMGVYVVSSQHNGGSEVLTAESGTVIDDLDNSASISLALTTAFQHPKTAKTAGSIRDSVRDLDFAKQQGVIVDSVLGGMNFQ